MATYAREREREIKHMFYEFHRKINRKKFLQKEEHKPLKDILPNIVQNVFQLFQYSIQVGCRNLEAAKSGESLAQN